MPRYSETLGIRRASQSNDRQVLPTPMMAHIKANASATVADDRCMRRCAWPHEYFDPTGIEAFRIVSQEERIQEARDCAKHLGFTFSINFENPVKEYREEVLIGQFEELINQHKPHTLFAPYPSFNQDHRAVHDAALIATRPHDTNHDVSNVLLYEQVHVSLWPYRENNLRGLTFHPAYFVPIDIERKLEAYRLHASQVRGMRSPEIVQTLARWRGYQSGFDYAEGFQVLRLKDPRRLALGLLKSEEETS